MSWKQASPILYLMLMFLLAEDLGLHIFADANAIECTFSWDLPAAWNTRKHLCGVSKPGYEVVTYSCEWCGRNDKQPPSAYGCVAPDGTELGPKVSLPCDAGTETSTKPKLPITCRKVDKDKNPIVYYCKSRHLNQQCPEDKCKL
ncbi:uncharacterized protein MELLADRAFT_123558 [Melampsora larici-populina 98AG31]|uniref:Secreted protein n=1 Tax=Melampsora larici-populina (strain 98AG31 / pathotype 3-4-7) TaxID=747676 RepID=F4S7L5_MELLP|nr:uncharacterized protein MELLADRAFT_123558 [Melampsora larici-populina 98AG31]EGF99341.1 secreted protein [Melampsora larici-populina 98AG31]